MSDNTLNPMESKNIKDYLHLYLNQQVQVRKKNDSDREYLQGRICEVTKSSNHGDWIKVWFDDIHTVTNSTWNQLTSNAHTFFIGEDEIKLILRPLSDMTIEEGAWCLKAVFFDHVEYPIRDFKLELVGEEKKNPRISIDNDWFINSLTFGNKTGSIWFAEDPSRNVKIPASVFAYLLSCGFDLFGLIDAGLAIKKSQ